MARFCVLDLAPEAPWRCPDDCPRFAPRSADAGWSHGSLVEPPIEDEPDDGDDVAGLLDQAEDIVNAVVPEAREEVRHERDKAEGTSPWQRAIRRFGRRGQRDPGGEEGFGGRRGSGK